MRLTDRQIREAKGKEKPYKLTDGDGLYLLVQPNGSKYWRFKYRHLTKEKVMAFGVYPEISLADARERRFDARKLKAKEIDPGEHKKEQRRIAIQKDRDTFEHIAREWHEWKGSTLSDYYSKQILQRLEKDVFPKIGRRPISSITAAELLKMARSIEDRDAYEMTHRAVQICGQVFQYAVVTERADRNPAADLKGFLKTRAVKHHPYITHQELPKFLAALEAYQRSDRTKLALKLLMLTMVRPNELCEAKWSEVDLERREWTISGARMKMRRTHIVPLSRQACEILRILKQTQRKSDFVLPSDKSAAQGISTNALLFVIHAMGYKGKVTSHGFRATASTILNESGLFASDIIERQLAHKEPDRVKASYDHSAHLPARHKMVQWWGDYLDKAV